MSSWDPIAAQDDAVELLCLSIGSLRPGNPSLPRSTSCHLVANTTYKQHTPSSSSHPRHGPWTFALEDFPRPNSCRQQDTSSRPGGRDGQRRESGSQPGPHTNIQTAIRNSLEHPAFAPPPLARLVSHFSHIPEIILQSRQRAAGRNAVSTMVDNPDVRE